MWPIQTSSSTDSLAFCSIASIDLGQDSGQLSAASGRISRRQPGGRCRPRRSAAGAAVEQRQRPDLTETASCLQALWASLVTYRNYSARPGRPRRTLRPQGDQRRTAAIRAGFEPRTNGRVLLPLVRYGEDLPASIVKLAHGGNPVTRWMAANVAVAQDPAGNLKPAKDKSTERIDGIIAIIMAIGAAWSPRRSPSPSTPCSLCERFFFGDCIDDRQRRRRSGPRRQP
jgi:Phage Terminase